MSKLEEEALRLAKHGLPLMPIRSVCNGDLGEFYDFYDSIPSSSVKQVQDWWQRWPAAGICIAFSVANIWSLTIPNEKPDLLSELARKQNADLPECPVSMSARETTFYFSEHPEFPFDYAGESYGLYCGIPFCKLDAIGKEAPPGSDSSQRWLPGRSIFEVAIPTIPSWLAGQLMGLNDNGEIRDGDKFN